MGKYTVLEDRRVDELVEKHLAVAVREITKIQGVLSVVLVGGFGRGEGSILLDQKKILPLNDYDIYLISEAEIGEDVLNETANGIEKAVGSQGFSLYEASAKDFYFDLRCIQVDKLKTLPPFIKYYEMRHASRIIWGNDYRYLIPDYKPSDLPISEGVRFILNRLSSIFLWNPYMPQRLDGWQDWEHRVFFYDISKLYIECTTILCQLIKVYVPTYQGRLSNLENSWKIKCGSLDRKFPDLINRIKNYTQMKLDPKLPEKPDYVSIWLQARDDAMGVLSYVLDKKFGLKITDLGSLGFAFNYFSPYLHSLLKFRHLNKIPLVIYPTFLISQLYLRLNWVKRLISFDKFGFGLFTSFLDPGLGIFQSLIYLSQALKNDFRIDDGYLQKAKSVLQSVYPVNRSRDTYKLFVGLYDDYVSAWKKYFFMKLTSV